MLFPILGDQQGSHRTRSRAAPDWTVEESLTLVNEISAVEAEWGPTLPSFQRWQQIVENCNALGVSRNLNQCKRRWDALLGEYRRTASDEKGSSGANGSFPSELFRAVDKCVNGGGGDDDRDKKKKKKNGGGVVEDEVEEQKVMDTDPDTDPDAMDLVNKLSLVSGPKKQRPRMKRRKRGVKPWGYFTCTNIKNEESCNVNENNAMNTTKEIVNSPIEECDKTEKKEQLLAAILTENALQINTILEGKLAEDLDYKLSELRNSEAVQTDTVRKQADQLIDCLAKISSTLNQYRGMVQQCN